MLEVGRLVQDIARRIFHLKLQICMKAASTVHSHIIPTCSQTYKKSVNVKLKMLGPCMWYI